jgi:hypothetical protein
MDLSPHQATLFNMVRLSHELRDDQLTCELAHRYLAVYPNGRRRGDVESLVQSLGTDGCQGDTVPDAPDLEDVAPVEDVEARPMLGEQTSQLENQTEEAAQEAPSNRAGTTRRRPWGWVSLGLASAALIGGVTILGVVYGTHAAADDPAHPGHLRPDATDSQRAIWGVGTELEISAWVLVGVGLSFAIASGVLLLARRAPLTSWTPLGGMGQL